MTILFDSYPVYDARREREHVARLGLPFLSGLERANSFSVPLGVSPSRGWICLRRGDLDELDVDALHTLTFNDGTNEVVLQNIVFIKGQNLTPGLADDPNAVYLCELSDTRWLCHNPYYSVANDRTYNLPSVNHGGAYLPDSQDSGSDWTWSTMCQSLWERLPRLGTYPELPSGVTPDTKPTGFNYIGVSAWLALCEVLNRIGCAVACDLLLTSPFSIVQIGAADAAFSALQTANASSKIYDGEFIESNLAHFPSKVKVFFNRINTHYGSEQTTPNTDENWWTTPNFTKEVDTGISGAETASSPVWDDLVGIAKLDETLTTASNSALIARAADHAASWQKLVDDGGNRLHAIYSGCLAFKPSSKLKGHAWRMLGDGTDKNGIVTEIVNYPSRMLAVGDSGQWIERFDFGQSVNTFSPDLRPTWPLYPHLLQNIEVTSSSADGDGLWTGSVVQVDPPNVLYSVKEDCVVWPLNDATLSPNTLYMGRLVGQWDTGSGIVPMYTVSATAAAAAQKFVQLIAVQYTAGEFKQYSWYGVSSVTRVANKLVFTTDPTDHGEPGNFPIFHEDNAKLPLGDFVLVRKGDGDFWWITKLPWVDFVRLTGDVDTDPSSLGDVGFMAEVDDTNPSSPSVVDGDQVRCTDLNA